MKHMKLMDYLIIHSEKSIWKSWQTLHQVGLITWCPKHWQLMIGHRKMLQYEPWEWMGYSGYSTVRHYWPSQIANHLISTCHGPPPSSQSPMSSSGAGQKGQLSSKKRESSQQHCFRRANPNSDIKRLKHVGHLNAGLPLLDLLGIELKLWLESSLMLKVWSLGN